MMMLTLIVNSADVSSSITMASTTSHQHQHNHHHTHNTHHRNDWETLKNWTSTLIDKSVTYKTRVIHWKDDFCQSSNLISCRNFELLIYCLFIIIFLFIMKA